MRLIVFEMNLFFIQWLRLGAAGVLVYLWFFEDK